MSERRATSNGAEAALLLLPGQDTSRRVVVVLRTRSDHGLRGTWSERVGGPWSDPGDADGQLAELRLAKSEARLADLPWLVVAGEDVAAAYLDEKRPEPTPPW